MAELEQTIKNLERNIRLLIKKNRRLEQELNKTRDEKKTLEEKNASIASSLEQISLQNSIMKSSIQKLDAEERKAAEKQIQQFIQEIDRCIAFLSR
jgi:chromosome segregation ATPase